MTKNFLQFAKSSAGSLRRKGFEEDINSMEASHAGGCWSLWSLYLHDRSRSKAFISSRNSSNYGVSRLKPLRQFHLPESTLYFGLSSTFPWADYISTVQKFAPLSMRVCKIACKFSYLLIQTLEVHFVVVKFHILPKNQIHFHAG